MKSYFQRNSHEKKQKPILHSENTFYFLFASVYFYLSKNTKQCCRFLNGYSMWGCESPPGCWFGRKHSLMDLLELMVSNPASGFSAQIHFFWFLNQGLMKNSLEPNWSFLLRSPRSVPEHEAILKEPNVVVRPQKITIIVIK